LGLQTKLTVNHPGDAYEQEADHIADQVLAAPTHSRFRGTPVRIQRFAGQFNGQVSSAPDSIAQTLSSFGSPLEPALQQDMERRFGHDFSQVRVHSGAAAAQSAADVNAQAYTVGHNVVFGAGRFAPGTQVGRRLLAHELTHVVQQATSLSSTIQRQPDEEEVSAEDFAKKLEKESLFQKAENAVREKILKEIKDGPKTITKKIFDTIVDSAPIDQQYKNGLKKVGEAIIKIITGRKSAPIDRCDAVPGYYEGKSSSFKGMCCRKGTRESAENCCPRDKFAPEQGGSNCCQANEFVNAERKCEKAGIGPDTCEGTRDIFGKCCMPPSNVIDGVCVKPEPPRQPFTLQFTVGVIDDYNIDQSILNARQKPHFEKLKQQIHLFMEACPSSIVTIVGFADKPGSEEHNFGLGQRRADHIKFLLQLDLIRINSRGMSPLIFARSGGESNPADPAAGEKFSAKNRRIEIEFNSICPPLGTPSPTKPLIDSPLRMRSRHSTSGEF
jgi:flagellar motor protein MotB